MFLKRNFISLGIFCFNWIFILDILIGFLLLTIADSGLSNKERIKTFCQWEDVAVNCTRNEVIMVHKAHFGRLERGRCIKTDYGVIGCATDVSSYLDFKCSGQQTCHFRVYDDVLREVKPCNQELSKNLKLIYTCLKVEFGSPGSCRTTHNVKLKSSVGHIAASTTAELNIGTEACPWVIEALPGQKVNFTLFNFVRGNKYRQNTETNSEHLCYEIAKINEPSGYNKRVTVCDGSPRESIIYISNSNKASLSFVNAVSLSTIGAFVVRYEAIGCPNLQIPPGAKVQYNGDDAIVRCISSGHTRYLTCKNNKWIGNAGNCSEDTAATLGHLFSNTDNFPYGILLVVAIGVSLGVFCGGLLLSAMVVFMRRKNSHANQPTELRQRLESDDKYFTYDRRYSSYKRSVSSPGTDTAPISLSGNTLNSYLSGELDPSKPLPQILPYDETFEGSIPLGYDDFDERHIYESPRFM